jgi:hypothetical protein
LRFSRKAAIPSSWSVLSRASIKAGNMLLLSFRAANRDPCGAYRLSAALARGGKDPFDLPFLSTHPGHEERMASADALSLRLKGRPCA